MGEAWMKWTLLEALTKTLSKLLQKSVGSLSSVMADVFFAAMIVGLVQMVMGYIVMRRRGVSLGLSRSVLGWTAAFGLLALVSTSLSFAVFLLGGDLGVNTLFITLAIVPGALIDSLLFAHPLGGRGWFGVTLAVLAGYVILGMPSLAAVMHFPLWVWLSILTMFSVTANQFITQKVKDMDPFAKNFWGGCTSVIVCIPLIAMLSGFGRYTTTPAATAKLAAVSAVIGVIVVGMWCFNLLSYRDGARLALKKLVLNGTYLSTAMVGGVICFGEPIGWTKVAGVVLYCVAFIFLDDGTWKYVTGKKPQ